MHTHLIPARDYAHLDEAVDEACRGALEERLVRMLRSLSADQRPKTRMPVGQATLLWLKQHMPATAEKVLSRVRASLLA